MNRMKIATCLCMLFLLQALVCPLAAQVIRDNNSIVRPIDRNISPSPPDTLDFGNFTLIVDSFASTGSWDAATLTFQHLSGTGRISFGCQPAVIFPVKLPQGIHPYIREIDIHAVESVHDPAHEISLQQLKNAGITAKTGDKFQIGLQPSDILPNGNLQQLLKNGIYYAPPGATYNFTDVTASVHASGASSGIVKAGSAQYPASPGQGSFTLNLSPGFQLQVSAVNITPGQDAQVTAVLTLPPSLSGTGAYGQAQLSLGVISISNQCEFYKVLGDSVFGVFGVGNTTLGISGKGYVADFSTTTGYPGLPVMNSWKGVVLLDGESTGTPGDSVVSNVGYLQGNYAFSKGLVEDSGLSAVFNLKHGYAYKTLQPLGYGIGFDTARVNVVSSAVAGGFIKGGKVLLPQQAVTQITNSDIELTGAELEIKPNMDLLGKADISAAETLCWGDLVGVGGGKQKSFGITLFQNPALLYFSATPKLIALHFDNAATSIFDTTKTLTLQKVDAYGMQGATFTGFNTLFINSPQAPGHFNPINMGTSAATSHLVFQLGKQATRWLNVASQGVHCNIHAAINQADTVFVGKPSQSLYGGGTPFTIEPVAGGGSAVTFERPKIDSILLQSVESAVRKCNYQASLLEPQPTGGTFKFTGMVFTSTANVAGGDIDIGLNDSLSYWGLKLATKPGFASGGTLSVRTGQIILTASGLSESRHFAQPFWLTWGEIMANGSVGQLFFDYNSANQQFDKLNFVTTGVALSQYSTQPGVTPFLHVGGNIHFPFFGGTFMNLEDDYVPAKNTSPFNQRFVKLGLLASQGIQASNQKVYGNWRDGLGIFNFTLDYDSQDQDGFIGAGISNLLSVIGGGISSSIRMNSQGQCMQLGIDTTEIRSVSLGVVANVSGIAQIWGCACIMNDDISNVVVGGSVTGAANASVLIRAGAYLSAILQITPAMTRYTMDGEASLSILASLDAEINGHMQLTVNTAQGYVDGELNGDISMSEGVILESLSVDAQGQLDWHMGTDYQSIQGDVSLSILGATTFGVGSGVNAGAGFYIGIGAPKADAWVLTNSDPQYGLNTTALPPTLTGFYGYLHIQQGISLFVVSGQYDLFVGLGAFLLSAPQQASLPGGFATGVGLPYIVGNVGGGINGEILGGLVSAGANFDLQIIGPYPFSFQGSVGLQGCVLWVACGSVSITVGLNSSQGFYIQ